MQLGRFDFPGLVAICTSLLLSVGLAACRTGGSASADDLPVVFLDTHHADISRTDTAADGGDAGRDQGHEGDAVFDTVADEGADPLTVLDVADDPGPFDQGPSDPGSHDPGLDPGASDPGAEAAGCGTGPACAQGTTCINAICESCRFQFACGQDCVECTGTATPFCLDGSCVRCRVGSDCADGFWCDGATHACRQCGVDYPVHCGAECKTCPADLPVCLGGACLCNQTSCGALFCVEGACQGCDNDLACGPSCAACPIETPRCVGGTCLTCRDPGDCPADQWCSAGTCRPCTADDPAHCGSACVKCSGDMPACSAGSCVCDGFSCGEGRRCTAGTCENCNLDEACGPACVKCEGATKFCISGSCRQCRSATDCPADWACGADGACIDPCAGTLGCANDFAPDGRKGGTARVLGRTVLNAGTTVAGDTTDEGNDDDLPSIGGPDCWDAVDDVMYKVWMRNGDTIRVTADPIPSVFDLSLKLYRGTTCKSAWKTDLIVCQHAGSSGAPESVQYTATADGWLTIVVDGESGTDIDDFGPFSMTASLACADTGCCCR